MNLSVSSYDDLSARIAAVRDEHGERRPGAAADGRQPVHTVYVPADRFSRTTPADFGAEALRLLNTHAPGDGSFGAVFALGPELAGPVRERVAAKLATEPVEDVRIDFEDGYGTRSDAEEDAHVEQVVEAVAAAYQVKALPHYWGVRVKSFADGGHDRSMRTLDGFLTTLRDRLGRLPGGFTITFPKVVTAEHVALFTEWLEHLETSLGLPTGILRFEVQIETPQAVVDDDGRIGLRAIVDAAAGRLTAAHFGVYDYTAALGLPPHEQRLDHPACDFARHVMQVSLAGTGVRLSDGSTNVVPRNDGPDEVNATWATHAAHVRHSLRHGFYQGWDLHPAHLPSRYAAVYAFHLAGVDDVIGRVRAWHEQAAAGGNGVLDEPATIRALTSRLRRAVDCGALDESVLPS
ncbi:HpcH/HpaI aldolase/citrate lyase family protein [Actinomadura pelletieri DSM 43383]|uniref:HpcH/HpaI aldolase/citrate lyase family protein n=1 Tax=Actinomadura pelletieri DSM 43383 TaxID=1120940 RepID=A0A495QNK9_9ACTN|nr:aldolase/citrate lyase family protein [Actinomadura pelletieri]RKS74554.1 HpcH/HpaI aldolase/citrate lyase family protein [Actinomadura pelletieri DSM 43383]